MLRRIRLASVAFFGAGVVLPLLLTASPALAVPSDCDTWLSPDGYAAAGWCNAGTGEHQFYVEACNESETECRKIYGDWMPPGSASYVVVGNLEHVVSTGFILRD